MQPSAQGQRGPVEQTRGSVAPSGARQLGRLALASVFTTVPVFFVAIAIAILGADIAGPPITQLALRAFVVLMFGSLAALAIIPISRIVVGREDLDALALSRRSDGRSYRALALRCPSCGEPTPAPRAESKRASACPTCALPASLRRGYEVEATGRVASFAVAGIFAAVACLAVFVASAPTTRR